MRCIIYYRLRYKGQQSPPPQREEKPYFDFAQRMATICHQARNAILGLIQAMRFDFDLLERSHDDILALCRKADLVVVPTAVAAGKDEAKQLDLPYPSVTLMPWAISCDHSASAWRIELSTAWLRRAFTKFWTVSTIRSRCARPGRTIFS